MSKDISTGDTGLNTDLLDHAGEFVQRVAEGAPSEYRKLLEQGSMRRLLAEDNAFNPGKAYAWAEFLVFRREFDTRFPQASAGACINAFCKLFLKNDISMSNLLAFFEGEARQAEEKRLIGRRNA